MNEPTLSREAVIGRAVAIADAEGLDAVTIRRVAQEFGVTPMALYWHVRNKDELLAAMGDCLFAGVETEVDETAPWPDRLRALLESLLAAMRRHPALLPMAFARVLQCDDGRAAAESVLGILREAGFSVREAANIAAHTLRTAIGLVQDEPGTENGVPDPDLAENLRIKRAALAALPSERYPNVIQATDHLLDCDDQAEYDQVGIDLFVAGVEALSRRVAATI